MPKYDYTKFHAAPGVFGADEQGIETGELEEALLYLSRFQHGTLATRVDVDTREVTAILQAQQLADKRKSEVLEMLDAEVDRILEKVQEANLLRRQAGSSK